ncbi:MAG TPA: pantetheine-phosphate adenylyltransferase [Cytophagales bacterium]|nr:pantetheine-phosphate adenylyltransferase [Cytophagales bacterium]HAA24290.1 pantetheine-phosphate adenylyltransferase [Cytophagales bacterium]HAP64344.1 pantetheine-phosphate adenylyltransferase [Cytophagales bacterium]
MDKRVAIFPGSFDPFTKGHEDIVLRSLSLFDEVHVAIGHNSKKNNRYFAVEWMIQKIEETFQDFPQVHVFTYNELTASLAEKKGAQFMIRGLRNTTDFEYENSIAQVNRKLNPELETVFLITSPKWAAISSTIIREVHKYQGDVTEFLPYSLD